MPKNCYNEYWKHIKQFSTYTSEEEYDDYYGQDEISQPYNFEYQINQNKKYQIDKYVLSKMIYFIS